MTKTEKELTTKELRITILVVLLICFGVFVYVFYPVWKLNSGNFGGQCKNLCEEKGMELSWQNPRSCGCKDRDIIMGIYEMEDYNFTDYYSPIFDRPIPSTLSYLFGGI